MDNTRLSLLLAYRTCFCRSRGYPPHYIRIVSMLDSCMDYVLFEYLRHELSIFTLPHSFPFFTHFRRHFSKNTTGLPRLSSLPSLPNVWIKLFAWSLAPPDRRASSCKTANGKWTRVAVELPRTLPAELTSTIVTSVVGISTTSRSFDFILVAIDRLFHKDWFQIKWDYATVVCILTFSLGLGSLEFLWVHDTRLLSLQWLLRSVFQYVFNHPGCHTCFLHYCRCSLAQSWL
jgi:hypothetical protein